MAALVWLLIPAVGCLIATLWGVWASRRSTGERGVHDSVGVRQYQAFRAAMERPPRVADGPAPAARRARTAASRTATAVPRTATAARPETAARTGAAAARGGADPAARGGRTGAAGRSARPDSSGPAAPVVLGGRATARADG